MNYYIFSSLFNKQDLLLKRQDGIISFPPLRTETNSIDGVGLANHRDFNLTTGVYEIQVEAIVKGALQIQVALCAGTSHDNQSISIRGLTQVRNTPDEIRCVTLNTVFSIEKPERVSLCFCADRPQIYLVSENIWTYYSVKGILKKVSDIHDNKLNLIGKNNLIDWETRTYKK